LATVVLGNSLAASDQMIRATLSQATSLDADGWYFAFEFSRERIPSGAEQVGRCCLAGLILASTGKPVLHAYAGPLGLISFGFGSTGAGIGHSQNLWQFSSGRWEPPSGQGGSGDAPARFFSSSLWGTVIHPDETVQLPTSLRSKVLTESPFVSPWNRWNANKHFVFSVCRTVAAISKLKNARSCAKEAVSVLQRAVALHGNIKAAGITLRDQTASYQSNWLKAVSGALNSYANDYDYLDLLE
jgi:hypothetical protein